MGREIRRVPPNWKHPIAEYCKHRPTCTKTCYKPMYEKSYDEACKEWIDEFQKWQNGERPDYYVEGENSKYFWDFHGMPPEQEYYNTFYKKEDATWYQVYQTVSEGTPVTPPFETQQELIDYLVEHGTFWNEKLTREQAEKFVLEDGHLMSMTYQDGKIYNGFEQLDIK